MLVSPWKLGEFSRGSENNSSTLNVEAQNEHVKTVKRKSLKVNFKKTRRGTRKSAKVATKYLIFAGVNPAGARAKWNTWRKVIRQSQASVWKHNAHNLIH